MKICKVKPDSSTCFACLATQEMFDVVDYCSHCSSNNETTKFYKSERDLGVAIMPWYKEMELLRKLF